MVKENSTISLADSRRDMADMRGSGPVGAFKNSRTSVFERMLFCYVLSWYKQSITEKYCFLSVLEPAQV